MLSCNSPIQGGALSVYIYQRFLGEFGIKRYDHAGIRLTISP